MGIVCNNPISIGLFAIMKSLTQVTKLQNNRAATETICVSLRLCAALMATRDCCYILISSQVSTHHWQLVPIVMAAVASSFSDAANQLNSPDDLIPNYYILLSSYFFSIIVMCSVFLRQYDECLLKYLKMLSSSFPF